jgi:hypothetical protein
METKSSGISFTLPAEKNPPLLTKPTNLPETANEIFRIYHCLLSVCLQQN